MHAFLKKAQSSAESIANIKVFDCNALQVKKRLGQGAFGDVYTTEFAKTVDFCIQILDWKNRVLVMTKYTKIVNNTYISTLLEFNCVTKFDKRYPIVNLTRVVPSINCGCPD